MISCVTSNNERFAAPLRAMISTSRLGSISWRSWRKHSLTRRLTRLRTTAFPTLELTVTPKRVSARSVACVMTTKFAVCSFFPERDRLVNSGRFLRRASLGNLAPTLLPIGRAYGSGSGSFRRYRHRQLLSSFGPAPAQNVSASGRFHSGQKTVRPFTSYVAGLISSFHFGFAPYAESLLSVGFPYVKTSGRFRGCRIRHCRTNIVRL